MAYQIEELHVNVHLSDRVHVCVCVCVCVCDSMYVHQYTMAVCESYYSSSPLLTRLHSKAVRFKGNFNSRN